MYGRQLLGTRNSKFFGKYKNLCHRTDLALFYHFVFEGNFQVQAPEDLYWEGRLNGGFLRYEFGGLLFGGTYTYT